MSALVSAVGISLSHTHSCRHPKLLNSVFYGRLQEPEERQSLLTLTALSREGEEDGSQIYQLLEYTVTQQR